MLIDDLKLGKFISLGFQGSVYEVYEKDAKRYAMKIIRVVDDGKNSTMANFTKSEWREIWFSTKFGNLYPNSFTQLYTYDFIDNANDFKYKKPLGDFEKNQSKYACRIVYEYVDDILKHIIYDLSKKQLYSMIIQITYAFMILRKNGYSQYDLKLDSIGVVRTTEKYVHLDSSLKIKTYGYIYKLIDYGGMFHESYNIHHNKKNKEMEFLTYILYKCDFEDKVFSHKHYDIDSSFTSHHLYKEVSKYSSILFYQYFLFAIMYPKEYQQFCRKNVNHRTYPIKLLVSVEDILYIIKHENRPEKIIHFFSSSTQ